MHRYVTFMGWILLACACLGGCSRPVAGPASPSPGSISAHFTSPNPGQSVNIFSISRAGVRGDAVCSGSLDGSSNFSCDTGVPSTDDDSGELGPLLIIATDASGAQFRAIYTDVPTDGAAQFEVDALTELEAARALALAGQGVLLDYAIAVADLELRTAMGLAGSDALTAISPVSPPTDPGAQEANTRGALMTAMQSTATQLGLGLGDFVGALGQDFAADRAFDGLGTGGAPVALPSGDPLAADAWNQVQSAFNQLIAGDPRYGTTYVYSLVLQSSPPPVPADFVVSGPVISIVSPFSLTWTSGLSDTYQVVICPSADFTASACQTVDGIAGLSTLFTLDVGNYFVKISTPDGRQAVNASDQNPYTFQVVTQ